MNANANYQDLKDSTKTFLQVITSNDLYYGLLLLAIMIILIKVIGLVFKPLRKKGSIFAGFIGGCLQAFVAVMFGFKIISLSETLEGFTSQIFMSSSLLVVVLGFVFQEGLANIVHGFILFAFKPFRIGDRISITVDGTPITGYVENIDLRSTIICNVLNSAHVIIPNAKVDTSVIGNSQYDRAHGSSSNFLDLGITYDSNLEKAIAMVAAAVEAHPYVRKSAEARGAQGEHVTVMVRDLAESAILLRATVITSTVEENFAACSDIRRELVREFSLTPDVSFAYPHVELVHHA